MTSVLLDLSCWASTLRYWEQAALEKIVRGVNFMEPDYDELMHYLLEDAELANPTTARPQLQFPQSTDAVSPSTKPTRLTKISNLQNVNALVSGQTLAFGPALTAIYGGNGSGKSGYARVLGCAGFTRGDREILPDVALPLDESIVLSADIQVTDGTSSQEIHYKVGVQCPELASFYVFDSTSVRVHLTQSNTLSFSPAGLSYLHLLAEVTDKVRERLRQKIEEHSQPHNFNAIFQGESNVSKMVAALGPDTSLVVLRQLAEISQDDHKRIGDLDLQIAQLKAQDITEQIAALEQKINDLENLASKLSEIYLGLNDQAVGTIQADISTYLQRQVAAQTLSIDQFKTEQLKQTGSDAWYQFARAAKALAEAEQTPDRQYPQAESRCLLCQQPLSPEARDLLLRLWAFLEGAAQARLAEVQALLSNKRRTLANIALDFFNDQLVSYRHLREYNKAALEKAESFIAGCRDRRNTLLNTIDSPIAAVQLPPLPDGPIPVIEQITTSLTAELDELRRKDSSAEIIQLDQQLRELRHRVALQQNFSTIEDYVQKRIWAQQAGKIGGSTRHITKKHNDLFKELVTDRYIELFEQILKELGRPLRVRVTTKGRKGETYKQIALEMDPSIPADKGTPDRVLSEGEKRAVALADFLTEVALDTTSNGIVLDDPVTSLDLEWRRLIASILVTQAKQRQAVVFTHDLPFLYFLKQYSEEEKVEIATHWIKRGDQDNKPGYVFLDNSPALERDYRKPTRAREIYLKAKNAPAADQEALLHDGFGALRTTYEAFIIFEMLAEVVMRFDERISFGRLKDIVWDDTIATEVITKCETLSKYIEGHLHSDVFSALKPTPALLLQEIEAFEALNKKLRDLKKSKA